MDRKPQSTTGAGCPSAAESPSALTVYFMGEGTPNWSSYPGITCHPLGSDLGDASLLELLDSNASAVVLMDTALLGEMDPGWVWSVQNALGPVVALGVNAEEMLGAQKSRVSGALPLSFLDVPGDVAHAVLKHYAGASMTNASEMERFMRDAVHEFRTPLTVMSEFTSLCNDGVGGPLTDKQHTYLAYVQAGAERLCRDFDDYRDSLRMQLGALKFNQDSTPLVDVLGAVAEVVDESIDLDWNLPCDVLLDEIDASRLVESIHRVTLAAEKLHRGDEPMALRVSSHASPGGTRHDVTVSFHGIEPAPVDIEVLATGLVEIEGSPRRSIARVFGLGIAMSQTFLNNCGGAVRLESVEGKGGSFVLSVPTRGCAERARAASRAA